MKIFIVFILCVTALLAKAQTVIQSDGKDTISLTAIKRGIAYQQDYNSRLPVPALYSKSNFTDLSDFTASDNFSVSGGRIVAVADGSGTKSLFLNNVVLGLQNYKVTVEYQVTADPTNSLGIRVNLASINSITNSRTYYGGYLMLAAGATNGSSYPSFTQGRMVTSWNTTGTQYNNIQRGSTITYQLGDTIRHEQYLSQRVNGSGVLECYGAFRIANLRTGAINYYEEVGNYNLGTTTYPHPNRSQLQIQCLGGTSATISKIEITTEYRQNRALVVGDSHTVGVFAGSYSNRVGSLIGAQADAGGSDKTVEALQTLPFIISSVRPRQVVLVLGTNDKINGVADATYLANMVSYTNQLTAAGIDFIVVSPYATSLADMSSYDALLKAQYTGKFISGYQLTKAAGSTAMKAAFDPGDAVHLNAAGQAVIANAIIRSGLYFTVPYYPNGSVFTYPSTDVNQIFQNGTTSTTGYTLRNIGIGTATPLYKFHVAGTSFLSSANSNHSIQVLENGGIGLFSTVPISVGNDVEITDNTKGIILRSPNSTRYRITVANGGTLVVTAL